MTISKGSLGNEWVKMSKFFFYMWKNDKLIKSSLRSYNPGDILDNAVL